MSATTVFPTENTLNIQREIEIAATPAIVWEALLEQLGPASDMPDGTPMPAKLEAWPGGRWFRDLGNNTGHLWGHVQVIKPPKILEIYGPMFMSYAAINHVQYRLTESGKGTTLALVHQAFGDISRQHRESVHTGWEHVMKRVREKADKRSSKK